MATQLPIRFQRLYAEALDNDYAFTTAQRTAYLGNALRYSGQIVLDTTEDKMYRLNFARNAWLPLGSSALPDQAGNAGKFLKTDGTTASWQSVPPGYTDSDVAIKVEAMFDDSSLNGDIELRHIKPSDIITTDILSSQQVLLSDTVNWSTPTSSSASYYIGATALTGNYQGQFYFDGLFYYFFIADDYPIRLGGTVNGVNLDTITQTKLAYATTEDFTLRTDPDIKTTSDPVAIKGYVNTITALYTASNGTTPTSTNFTYNYRVSTSSSYTIGVTLATLNSALANSSLVDKIVYVTATNTTETVPAAVVLTVKKYA